MDRGYSRQLILLGLVLIWVITNSILFAFWNLPTVVCYVLRLFHGMVRVLIWTMEIKFFPEWRIQIVDSSTITLSHLTTAHRWTTLSEVHVDHSVVVVDDWYILCLTLTQRRSQRLLLLLLLLFQIVDWRDIFLDRAFLLIQALIWIAASLLLIKAELGLLICSLLLMILYFVRLFVIEAFQFTSCSCWQVVKWFLLAFDSWYLFHLSLSKLLKIHSSPMLLKSRLSLIDFNCRWDVCSLSHATWLGLLI